MNRTEETHDRIQRTTKLAVTSLIVAVAMLCVLLFVLMPRTSRHRREPSPRVVCGTNLKGLGSAMFVYANEFDDELPPPEKWCDVLIQHDMTRPKQFVCKEGGAVIGESSYALNENVVGRKLGELPPDMVVLFETDLGIDPAGRNELYGNRDSIKFIHADDPNFAKSPRAKRKVYKHRWNQVGGPQGLTAEHHKGDGANILFADSHVEFVKTQDFPRLKWKAKD